MIISSKIKMLMFCVIWSSNIFAISAYSKYSLYVSSHDTLMFVPLRLSKMCEVVPYNDNTFIYLSISNNGRNLSTLGVSSKKDYFYQFFCH